MNHGSCLINILWKFSMICLICKSLGHYTYQQTLTSISNRMDSGRFEILSKPYAFHAVMRTLLIPLRMATDARNLELVTYLDRTIDEVCYTHVNLDHYLIS